MEWFGVFFLIASASYLSWLLGCKDTSHRESKLNIREENFQKTVQAHQEKMLNEKEELTKARERFDEHQLAREAEFNRLFDEVKDFKSSLDMGVLQGRKWLANAFSEYIKTLDAQTSCLLVCKPKPAMRSAEKLDQISKERTEMMRQTKLLEFQVASYEEYFPFLQDYKESILDETVDIRNKGRVALDDADPALVLNYLSREEYESLTNAEKFQRALDRYWERWKNNEEIGHAYERYIGYLYEIDGWEVEYHGILKGFEDFGRDLICIKGSEVKLIQCKCWSKRKLIREKHIMQLYGSTIHYKINNVDKDVIPIFATPTPLSDEAKGFAEYLGIEIKKKPLEKYPLIKCNDNIHTGEKIYHLPFDQQYDRLKIGGQSHKFYVETVKEAEEAGYRRAFRWRGYNQDG